MLKLAGCLIVKDDSELIPLSKAVNSIAPYMDGVFITSTGKEVSMIRVYCEKNNLHYSHKDWTKDFSATRNFNFDQAVAHDSYDYLIWIDCDDLLIGGQYLRKVAEDAKTNH